MDTILTDSSPSALVKAMEGNLHAHIPLFGQMPRSTVWEEPGFKAVITALDPSECHVYQSQFQPQEAEANIMRVVERYCSQGCLPFYWQVCSSTLPVNMGEHLDRCSFQPFARPPGMAVDLRQLEQIGKLPDGFIIELVTTENQLRQWVDILAKVDSLSDALRDGFYQVFQSLGFGQGGDSQLFLGKENGVPVAGSRLFCATGVAGIWHVSTLPESRGRGYGTIMTLAAAHAGRELGCRYGVLFATPAGHGVYRRLGFQEYCHIEVYQSPKQELPEKN
jgi:ribosomal protein S18 acetylase RimI-like enzyme